MRLTFSVLTLCLISFLQVACGEDPPPRCIEKDPCNPGGSGGDDGSGGDAGNAGAAGSSAGEGGAKAQ